MTKGNKPFPKKKTGDKNARDKHGRDKNARDKNARDKNPNNKHKTGGRRDDRNFEARRDFDKPRRSFEEVLTERFSEVDLIEMHQNSLKRLKELLDANSTVSLPQQTVATQAPMPFAPSRSYSQTPPIKKTAEPAAPAPKLSNLLVSDAPRKPTVESSLKLDSWQKEALEALMDGANLIVDAPTSAGKTRVIEAFLEQKMKEGAKLVYTSPVKSLSNDKYREFCETYGKEKVGINTGDFKENLSAPIILATLETYRNSLLGVEPDMSRTMVVYDEYHYLQDESRGSAWEESLILTPRHTQLVLLSASVPNTQDFANWLKDLMQKDCKVITVSVRPVPLVDFIYTKYGWIFGDELKLNQLELSLLRKMNHAERRERRQQFGAQRFLDIVKPVVEILQVGCGPVVVYAGRRADTENIAHTVVKELRLQPEWPGLTTLRNRLVNLPGWEYVNPELQSIVSTYGVAYHHSGMIPPGRVAIESLLKEGLLRVCCGTMGISLGVNFAVRSALVSDESRPGEGGESRYTNSEILQMLGRAGRRGRDKQGFSLWFNLGRYASQKPYGREPCRSSLKIDPSTVLSILGNNSDFQYLTEFYRKSFFMRGKDPKALIVDEDKKGLLHGIVNHLQRMGALNNATPTVLGTLARHFPQSGGIIIASWLADGKMTGKTFPNFVQAMATFCTAHFKDVPDTHSNMKFLQELQIPKLIEKFYPEDIFPDLYDEVSYGPLKGQHVFREFNLGASSIIAAWLKPKMTWEKLVEEHSSKHFSAGDCMMVLFRFATYLQSCARLFEFDADISAQAKALTKIILREPLDARNRMLADDVEDKEGEEELLAPKDPVLAADLNPDVEILPEPPLILLEDLPEAGD